MFLNGAGQAVDPDSYLRRIILPALDVCGVCSKPKAKHRASTDHKYQRNVVLPRWHGWHAFRRGLATNLHRLGVPDVTIQRILRHSNVAVTQACYIKTASEETRAAMQKLDAALTDTKVTPKHLVSINRAVQ